MEQKVKKFGLHEARALEARRLKPHVPTLHAVLCVFGISNTVKEEGAAEVAGNEQTIKGAYGSIAGYHAADATDAQTTQEQVQRLLAERASRLAQNERDIKRQEEVVGVKRGEIAKTRGMVKKYGV